MSKSIVLTNAALINLLTSTNIVHQIPQLRGPVKMLKSIKGCNCGGTRAKRRARAIQDMKTMIPGWTDEQKQAFKRAIGVKHVSLYIGKKLVEIK